MQPTTDTAKELKMRINDALKVLRRLRDEIQVEMHLAGMEAKDRWHALEPKLAEAEKLGHDVSEASRKMVQDTLEAFRAFKATFTEKRKS